jgi:guanyl-specific ribonuclease Sa
MNVLTRFRSSSFSKITAVAVVLMMSSVALASFSAWSVIKPAIAKVPTTVGPITSVKVINFGKVIYTGPLDVTKTITRIRNNQGPTSSDDGSVFSNYQKLLPTQTSGYYREFVVSPSTGTNKVFNITFPGPMRLVLGKNGELYFTGDHYSSFTRIH